MYLILQSEIMVPPGASGKRCLVRPEADHSVSGVTATEDLKPTTPMEKEMKEYKQPRRVREDFISQNALLDLFLKRYTKGTDCPEDSWLLELVDRDKKLNSPSVIKDETVSDLLSHLDPHKSMGPDGIHPRVMRELAEELAKPLSIISQQSWLTGEVPDDWKLENAMPIHKKGQKEDPGNSRPVSLTSVLWSRSS
ncbi:hypothetical protein BTVI_03083 [Pitangus sulphuratus]|nr:hypothetical protein BTVI_03083 [Pitangus sulphuratus]